ncbi:MAG: hypothetical protein NVS2B17_23660 [Candidatus Velthaea sp.]
MRRIKTSIPVHAPRDFTLSFLSTYLHDSEGLRLRLPLQSFGSALSLATGAGAGVEYSRRELAVRWMPQGNGAFPRFDGIMTAEDDGPEGCSLKIAGAYDPPGNVPGPAFDELAGGRIARSTLEGLLHELRSAVEADYALRTA